MINNRPFIYISSLKLKPIFDTGSKNNYITKSFVEDLGLKIGSELKKNRGKISNLLKNKKIT